MQSDEKEKFIPMLTKLLALILLAAAIQPAQAQTPQWGTLTGKFVVQGKVPPPLVLNPGGVCAPGPILEERLIVGPKGELKNVAIWIAPQRGELAPDPHPDYQKLVGTPIHLDNLFCAFVPHLEVIWTKRPTHLRNRDPIAHNFRIDGFNKSFNTLVGAGEVQIQKFEQQEPVPSQVSCSIHPWMRSSLLIRDSPYAAATAKDGTFTIEKLPAGTWTFAFWHETGFLSDLKLNGETTNRRGQCQIKIEPGQVTDLGEIVIPVKDLQ